MAWRSDRRIQLRTRRICFTRGLIPLSNEPNTGIPASMLQGYAPESEAFYQGRGQVVDLGQYWAIFKRRALYCLAAFVIVLLLGAFVTAIQRPIYEAKGKLLVESQAIPTDLVQPTVTDSAYQRVQVIQQRIMTRDNLLALVKKYGMFSREQQWMSGTELLDLMRERTKFDLVDINSGARPGSSTIAFTVSFDYENPEIALRVANDLLTLILNEDARNRTNRAEETTEFLAHESDRLQGQLAAIQAQIAENQSHSQDPTSELTDPARIQAADLVKLKEELAEKSSTYSDAYPAIVALKKKIAAMERLIAKTPSPAAAAANPGLVELERRLIESEHNLDDTNKKLEQARLGEKLEKDQESEHLQVIEQPVLPQMPIKPNRPKLFALSFALAIVAGFGAIMATETLDKSVRHSHDLLDVADGRLIVSIPYIATRAESFRRKTRSAVFLGVIFAALVLAVAAFALYGPPVDLSAIKQFWVDHLTMLSK
jgi:uncharacterized protein involved in exopolysaccharide biosynthesis